MTALFENVQALGLLIQAMGAVLIAVLCLMLNRVERYSALSAWVCGWLSLGGALIALLIEQALPSSAPATLPLYLFGEYLFGYWIVAGCAHFGGRFWTHSWLPRLIVPLALVSWAIPQLIGYEFRRVFLLQSLVLACIFSAALIALASAARRAPSSPGLLAMRVALALLTALFLGYLPIFAANLWLNQPLPMTVLKLSSATHLVLEFLLGFGGAVLVLEQSHHGLLGRNDLLTADVAHLRGQAERDALTNAFNRRALLQRLAEVLTQAAAAATKVTLLYIDVDHFKNVNDTHGHTIGDQLLIEVARRLQQCVPGDDLVVRMGGDEFIVITRHPRDRDAVALLAQRIRSVVNEPLALNNVTLRVQVSIGISIYSEDGTTADVLLQHADVALYQAKASGRNGHRFFDAQMNQSAQEQALLMQALAVAIENRHLFVEYQPLVDLPSGRIIALEALVRWRHPQRGIVAPADFIPMAEQGGLIDAISDTVLRTVCGQLRAWQADGVLPVPIAINLSPRQFEQSRVVDLLVRVIEEYGIDPALIRVEITESALMKNVHEHAPTLHRLREFGIAVAIDDFGTGYSSLSYLKHLPIDCLKIDRSFVGNMASDARDTAVVRAIIGVAQSMDIVVVAEGVETSEQVAQLSALGCVAAQGTYYHPAMSADRCRPLLEELAADAPHRDTLRLRLLRWARMGSPSGM